MANNRTNEALEVMKTVYRINTGKPDSTFPVSTFQNISIRHFSTKKFQIKSLAAIDITENVQEVHDDKNRTKIQFLKDGFHQVAPLFCAHPYRMNMFLICCIQVGLMLR